MTRWTRHAIRILVIVGLLAPSAYFTPTPTANASPTLTASPTEVKVTKFAPMGKTTLTWNSGSSESVHIYIQIGADTYAPTGFVGSSGTAEHGGLQAGQTYKFRLYTMSGQPFPGSPTVVVTVKLVPIKINLGCAGPCIKTIDISPHVTDADVLVETTVDATVLLRLSDDPPNPDGSCKSSGNVGFEWKTNVAKAWNVHFDDLMAATKHCLTVIAKDTDGFEEIQHRTFTTKKRTAIAF